MAAQEQQLVLFELASALYGVAIQAVREIIRHEPVTALPDAAVAVNGVINLRGLVIPVVDLRTRLRLPSRPVDHNTRVIVADIQGTVTGFIVDAVAEVLRLPASAIEPAPALSMTADSDYIAGVAKLEDRLVLLIDVERLLSAEALRRFSQEVRRMAVDTPGVAAKRGVPALLTSASAGDEPRAPSLADLNIDLLEATFEAVKPRAAELVEWFYARLFEAYPSVVPLFAGTNPQEQQGKLLSALALVIASLRQPDALLAALQRLGEKHVGYGAVPAHYDAVGGVLLESLAHIAGDAWTDEVAKAWADALAVVAGVMIEAAEKVTLQAA